MEDQIKNRLDLNAEFLGITSLAVYSAPWFLQFLLLVIIGALFYYKIFSDSRNLVKDIELVYNTMQHVDKADLFDNYRTKFFGFDIHNDKIPAYWAALALFLITLLYALLNTLFKLSSLVI